MNFEFYEWKNNKEAKSNFYKQYCLIKVQLKSAFVLRDLPTFGTNIWEAFLAK